MSLENRLEFSCSPCSIFSTASASSAPHTQFPSTTVLLVAVLSIKRLSQKGWSIDQMFCSKSCGIVWVSSVFVDYPSRIAISQENG